MSNLITPIILCGGAGRRLWPLSTHKRPKQFLKLIRGQTLLQTTLDRVADKSIFNPPIIVCSQQHLALIPPLSCTIIAEPASRNTAPALCAALTALKHNQMLLVLPADHYIPNATAFASIIKTLQDQIPADHIATLGIKPTHPYTGYGYIEKGRPYNSALSKVNNFTEKPNLDTARRYAKSKNYLWNAGIFIGTRDTFINTFKTHAPTVLTTTQRAWINNKLDADIFARNQHISIDYAIMEHARNILTHETNLHWSDLGSWKSLLNALIHQAWHKKQH